MKMAGSAPSTGFTAAPTLADFTVSVATATSENINRIAGFPPSADRWTVLVVDALDGTVAFQNTAVGTPMVATPLVTGRTYRAQFAWAISPSLQRVSDWSPARTFVP